MSLLGFFSFLSPPRSFSPVGSCCWALLLPVVSVAVRSCSWRLLPLDVSAPSDLCGWMLLFPGVRSGVAVIFAPSGGDLGMYLVSSGTSRSFGGSGVEDCRSVICPLMMVLLPPSSARSSFLRTHLELVSLSLCSRDKDETSSTGCVYSVLVLHVVGTVPAFAWVR